MKEHDDWMAWLESEEGQRCSKPFEKFAVEHREYIVNRLWAAFSAGQSSGKRLAVESAVEKLRAILK